jgi:hypothetical protein
MDFESFLLASQSKHIEEIANILRSEIEILRMELSKITKSPVKVKIFKDFVENRKISKEIVENRKISKEIIENFKSHWNLKIRIKDLEDKIIEKRKIFSSEEILKDIQKIEGC